MDRRQSFGQRSPRREHRSREWSDRGSHDRDSRRRDSRSRSRSRSPKRAKTSSSRHDRHTEESSRRHKSSRHRPSHRHREHASRAADARTSVGLPFEARALSKLDLDAFEPLFANYLSIQKQKEIEDMDDREVRGRWKSFVGKWNRGELAEGWYDPEMFARVTGADLDNPRRTYLKAKDDVQQHDVSDVAEERRDGSEEDDDYGPVLPSRDPNRRAGPGIPTMTDLSLRNEQAEEDKQANMADLRELRKADRALQKERLDELVPRADAGTHERKMEKRQLVNDKMRSFRDKSPGMEAADDREVMGGGDSLEEYKRAKQNEQRRKTEREIRREEVDRAKREEMEERRKAWREREDGTMGMLKELARQRFG
ncbi:hypothetical protein EDB81DRAFT_27585 [Dactylonectria macrodidyma]|uniref:RNA helicase HEL117 n=1 Tax=Dactylonectria macrodidyma TaxID=307937 RepID=A0A9P9JMP3_9HYPO|nr:hypothetical protein EDB81DRAFT_27585 [Dactylonectria macrodidyma]